MKRIPVSNGKYYTMVDDIDYKYLSKRKWQYTKSNSNTVYVVGWEKDENNKDRRILMHRIIMDANKGIVVDHKNGNGLDNRRQNLRICTHSQNMANRSISTRNTSGYKGVMYHPNHSTKSPWLATICFQGKSVAIGLFETPQAAARAYNAKAKELFGEFAYLNPV
jgi:hypothetical protein